MDDDTNSKNINLKIEENEVKNTNNIEIIKNNSNFKPEKPNLDETKENKNSYNILENSNSLKIDSNNSNSNWHNIIEDNFNEIMSNDNLEEIERLNSESEESEEEDSESDNNNQLENKVLIDLNNQINPNKIIENNNSLQNEEKEKSNIINKKFQNLKIVDNYFQINNKNKLSSENIQFTLTSKISETEKDKSLQPTKNEKNFLNYSIDNKIKIKSYIEDKYIKQNSEESIIFNGKIFKRYEKANKYKTKDKIKRVIYKCINYRKYEKFRSGIKHNTFCNATIIYIMPNQKKKSGYLFKREHSEECNNIFLGNNSFNYKEKENNKFGKKIFIEECEKIMNNSSIYDRTLFKNQFKDLYNNNKYNFEINNNLLSNIITKWKQKSNRFTKYCVLDNFLDGTFHHPKEYKQLLVLMFHDLLTNQNIPGIFILINGKFEKFYEIVFKSMYNIITQNEEYQLKAKIIVTDSEIALLNALKKIIPNVMYITCFFHFAQDILRNIRNYHLYKKEQKK